MDDSRLAFFDDHIRSRWIRLEAAGKRFRGEPDGLVELLHEAETSEDRWRCMYRLAQALFYVGPERLRPMFREQVAPCFFRLYPKGKIVVLRYDTSVDEAASVLRTLYAMAQAPLPELLSNFQGIQTLQNWHMTSLTRLMPALLDLFNYLFYPFVGGTCANLFGLDFLFLLDPPEQHTPPPFPRNWLGFPSRSASFGREAADAIEVVTNFRGPAYWRDAHQRLCHTRVFTAEERLDLLRWYVARVNRVLYELTDVANFTEGGDLLAPVDPIFGFEHQLTVDRLMRKTLLAMSLDEAPVANLLAFEIADLYDTLSERFGNHANKPEFFKRLFNTQEGPALIGTRLAGLPAPFGPYLADLTAQVYDRIEQTVLTSVWRAAKVTPNGVMVRDKKLAGEVLIPVPQFVAA